MQDPWMQAMFRGDFAEAWRISDAVQLRRRNERIDCTHWPRHQQFIWDGTPLDNRGVLVRCYHGLGDTIQFVRLLAPLRSRVQHITLWAQPQLLSLLQHLEGVDVLLPLHEAMPDSHHDVDIEVMEIPHALRLDLCDIPQGVPYLHVPLADVRLPDALCIGLVTSAGAWNSSRSVPDEALQSLASIEHVSWFSLRFPIAKPPFPMQTLACEDIAVMASRMRALDLIIAVDTMQAHLAGALGLPTWLLLNANADWRWMRERNDSPWYPTMRLFRQQRQGEWDQVIREVRTALEELTRARDIRSAGCTASSD
ncbi:MAG: ADP-heptose--LPS heptosyltransferase [Povalibacter sp.]